MGLPRAFLWSRYFWVFSPGPLTITNLLRKIHHAGTPDLSPAIVNLAMKPGGNMLVEMTYRGKVKYVRTIRKVRVTKFFGRRSSYIETERQAIDRLVSSLYQHKGFRKSLSIKERDLVRFNIDSGLPPLSSIVKMQVCHHIPTRVYGPFDSDF